MEREIVIGLLNMGGEGQGPKVAPEPGDETALYLRLHDTTASTTNRHKGFAQL